MTDAVSATTGITEPTWLTEQLRRYAVLIQADPLRVWLPGVGVFALTPATDPKAGAAVLSVVRLYPGPGRTAHPTPALHPRPAAPRPARVLTTSCATGILDPRGQHRATVQAPRGLGVRRLAFRSRRAVAHFTEQTSSAQKASASASASTF